MSSNTSLAPLGSLAKLSVWLKFLNGPSSFPPFKSIKCNLQCSGCCFINTDTNNFRNSDLPNQLPLPQSCVDAFQSHVSLSLYTYVLRGLSTLSITMIHYMDTIFQVPSHKLGISTCRHNSFLVVYQVSPDC